MPRSIDEFPLPHQSAEVTRKKKVKPVDKWSRSYAACKRTMDNQDFALDCVHEYAESFVCEINRAHGYEIDLDAFEVKFYYVHQTDSGLNEIFKIYFDDPSPCSKTQCAYLFFNVPLFKTVYKDYCSAYAKHFLHFTDNDRGRVHYRVSRQAVGAADDYFKQLVCWHLLFVSLCHLMAHFDLFGKFENAFYNHHDSLKKSTFFNYCIRGQVSYEK